MMKLTPNTANLGSTDTSFCQSGGMGWPSSYTPGHQELSGSHILMDFEGCGNPTRQDQEGKGPLGQVHHTLPALARQWCRDLGLQREGGEFTGRWEEQVFGKQIFVMSWDTEKRFLGTVWLLSAHHT